MGNARAVIDFEAIPGIPDNGHRYLKDGEELDLSTIVEEKLGRLVLDKVTRSHGGIYTLQLNGEDNNIVHHDIKVTVVEEHRHSAAVGSTASISPDLAGDRECLHWERDGVNISSDSRYDNATERGVLRIATVSSDDVGRVFVCVAEGRLRVETRLLSKETLSLCVKRERNKHRITTVVRVSQRIVLCATHYTLKCY